MDLAKRIEQWKRDGTFNRGADESYESYARAGFIDDLIYAYEAQQARIANLEAAILEVEYLMSNSGGVYGLHMNGDPSPWSELLPPGRCSDLLTRFHEALAELKVKKGE